MVDPNHMHYNAIKELGNIESNKYNYQLFFEKWTIGKEDKITSWVQINWSLSVVAAVFYVLAIVAGKRLMQKREPFNLQLPLICWSGLLAVFSILATVRAWPEVYDIITEHGLRASLCHPCYYYDVPGFWSVLFIFSKIVELGDTFFIVARKQRLIFLHWYHHATVMMYVFYSYADHTAPGRWFYFMNYFVHAFMYSYYTLRAMRVRLPRQISIFITTLQISQMFVGNGVFVYLIVERAGYFNSSKDGVPPFCQISNANIFWGGSMYLSYLFLFINFFVQSYLVSHRSTATRRQNNGSESLKSENGKCSLSSESLDTSVRHRHYGPAEKRD